MGQFSWLDCKTKEQVLDNVPRKVYLLIPAAFGGGHIEEDCYDGYGRFGGQDVYELVLEFNKDREQIEKIIRLHKEGKWRGRFDSNTDEQLDRYSRGLLKAGDNVAPDSSDSLVPFEPRELGIVLACYDEDNARLKYPIKITHDPDAVYEDCEPSLSDPDQGWLIVEDDTDFDEADDDEARYDAWRENLLWDALANHYGHHVEIVKYGSDENDPSDVCLECTDCNEVILDAEIYTLCARED